MQAIYGPCHDPRFDVTAADLRDMTHLLPAAGCELLRVVGADRAAALMHRLPGVQLIVPKHPAANRAGARRWQQLAAVIQDDGMADLAAEYGGQALDIPTCAVLQAEKRNRWVRQRYDQLIAAGQSGRAAVYEIGIELAGAGRVMTYRQIERVLDAGDHTPPPAPQMALFSTN